MHLRNRFKMFLLIAILGQASLAGVYLLYWVGSIQSSLVKKNLSKTPSFLIITLTVFTLGIYGIIWQWKLCSILKTLNGEDKRICTLILNLLIIGLIFSPLIIQGQINRICENNQLSNKINC
ncbi:MAG: hypothetical protein E7372_02590 [Clostridiales bacterium]|nr:hypothetical protein [Clostridiales bacterium]